MDLLGTHPSTWPFLSIAEPGSPLRRDPDSCCIQFDYADHLYWTASLRSRYHQCFLCGDIDDNTRPVRICTERETSGPRSGTQRPSDLRRSAVVESLGASFACGPES